MFLQQEIVAILPVHLILAGFSTVLGSYQTAKNMISVGNTDESGVIVFQFKQRPGKRWKNQTGDSGTGNVCHILLSLLMLMALNQVPAWQHLQ